MRPIPEPKKTRQTGMVASTPRVRRAATSSSLAAMMLALSSVLVTSLARAGTL